MEEEDSEEVLKADGAGAIGMAAVVAMATTEEDTSAAIAKLLIIDLSNMWTDETDCLFSGLAVILFYWLPLRTINGWLGKMSVIYYGLSSKFSNLKTTISWV